MDYRRIPGLDPKILDDPIFQRINAEKNEVEVIRETKSR